MKMMPVTVMIKPASGLCNMRCRYCFYADETAKREVSSYGLMSAETQEAVTKRIMETAIYGCTIAFQGGEPTLAGLDFFHRQLELEKKYNVHHIKVNHAIQTNGLLIDDEWAAFFAENGFLVGVSLDGRKQLHDTYRVDAQGKGTYSRVMRAIQILKNHNVEFNILSVLTEQGARSVRSTYGFFARNGLVWQQYIACLDPLGCEPGHTEYSLSVDGFEQYLKSVFDCWYQDAMAGKLRYHRYFFNIMSLMLGRPPEACDMNGVCGTQYVVEADGSTYPCDFYMLDEWRLGNLVTDSFEELDKKRGELRFIELSAEALEHCRGCKWIGLCRGGCRRSREGITGTPLGENYFCAAYKAFFEYAAERLTQMAGLIQSGRLKME